MQITEVRIILENNSRDHLLAYGQITIDGWLVIRDLRIIQGDDKIFVSMPSRKIADKCPHCQRKNILTAKYCNECGQPLADNRAEPKPEGGFKLYSDIVFPINENARKVIEFVVVGAYRKELRASGRRIAS